MTTNQIRESIVRYRENIVRGKYEQCHVPCDNHHVWIGADVETVRDVLLDSDKFILQKHDDDYLGKYQMIHYGVHVLVGKGVMKPDWTSITLHTHLFRIPEQSDEECENRTPLFPKVQGMERNKRLVDTIEDMLNVCETKGFVMVTDRKEDDGYGCPKVGGYDTYTPNSDTR